MTTSPFTSNSQVIRRHVTSCSSRLPYTSALKVLVVICLTTFFCGCHRKNYPLESAYTPSLSPASELLASYVWKETSVIMYRLKGKDTIGYNITRQFEHLDKDDLTFFREDGTFVFEEGQTKFTPQSSQKYASGTWLLADKESTLTLKTPRSTDTYQVVTLDSTRLVLHLPFTKEHQKYYYEITHSPVGKSAYGEAKSPVVAPAIYTKVDQQPQYPGGLQALSHFMGKNQKYPQEARKKGIEGKVVVQFVISPEGTPGQFQVLESLGYGCDEAVLQTCRAMGKWQPALVNGKRVPAQVTLPVLFKL